MKLHALLATSALCLTLSCVTGNAQDVYGTYADADETHMGGKEYSPYLDQGYPDRVYFGDTHLHTSYSTDAGMFGTRLGPEDRPHF